MFLPKNWDSESFFSFYCNKKFKHNKIIEIIDKFDSFENYAKYIPDDAFQDIKTNSRNAANIILDNCFQKNVRLISYWDSNYPSALKNISSPPILLFIDGEIPVQDEKLISIVGTRNNTMYGKLMTERFVESFVNNSVGIVSGLAFGIDSIAHKKVLEMKGKTYAIVASGVDMLSSAQTEKMAQKIKDTGGAIISEYPCGTPAQRGYFPVRNRIISGLTKATLIVESGIKSGTLITAKFAFEQDREVYAIPGNINSEKSKGCNHLIKTNQAILCTDPEQILVDIGWKLAETESEQLELVLENPNEILLYNIIDHEPKQIDYISDAADLESSQVMVGLLNLEFKGLIKQLPGKNFIKV
jgi:DNA processing protein